MMGGCAYAPKGTSSCEPQISNFWSTHMPTYNETVQASYNNIPVPQDGEAIQYSNGKYSVPAHPIIPFIEGDGTGRDIWKASRRVFDAAVEKAYGGKRSVKWYEVLAGEKAFSQTKSWLPDDTV